MTWWRLCLVINKNITSEINGLKLITQKLGLITEQNIKGMCCSIHDFLWASKAGGSLI